MKDICNASTNETVATETSINNTAAAETSQEELTIAKCLQAILNDVTDRSTREDNEARGIDTSSDIESRYDYVTSKLDITRNQAEMLAAVLEICISCNVTIDRLSDKFRMSNLEFLSRMEDLDVLIDKRFIRTATSGMGGEINYYVPAEVITSIRKNEVPTHEYYENLCVSSMARKWSRSFQSFWRHDDNPTALFRDVLDIVRFNKKSEFKKAWNELAMDELSDENKVLFIYMITRNICYSDNSFTWNEVERLFEDSDNEIFIKEDLEHGRHRFFNMGFVEFESSEGMVDAATFKLTEECLKKFVGKDFKLNGNAENNDHIVRNGNISSKPMFYNEDEGRQISRLSTLLQKDNFDKVVARLEQKGMRKGFCALLFGSPGTGKTESVYQIARQTGRDLFIVDVADLRNKYVGESEKKVRALFQEYKALVRNSELAPILLFNEADAVLGIRMEGASKAVDRMENSIQNIILQEMESLEGIMIATTNLTCNLDKAFERRFIFKVNLSKPSEEARTHIWESLVEGIRPEDAESLAKEYDFSGAMIENISRKMTVDFILSGKEPELAEIRQMCKEETIDSVKKTERVRIGF